jgi:ABC-type bacteriocin/lantibiotic exporter with double-glycine peptidase domain
MKLKGPMAKIFGFSSKDHDKPGQFISSPLQPGKKATVYARHNVPFIHQTHVNLCGDACVNMLLAFKGRPYEAKLRNNPRGVLEGQSSNDLSARLKAAGLPHFALAHPESKQWAPTELAEYLQKFGPIICQGSMHFVLLVGIHENHVFIHDPWRGANMTKTLDEFNRFLYWQNTDCMIAAEV